MIYYSNDLGKTFKNASFPHNLMVYNYFRESGQYYALWQWYSIGVGPSPDSISEVASFYPNEGNYIFAGSAYCGGNYVAAVYVQHFEAEYGIFYYTGRVQNWVVNTSYTTTDYTDRSGIVGMMNFNGNCFALTLKGNWYSSPSGAVWTLVNSFPIAQNYDLVVIDYPKPRVWLLCNPTEIYPYCTLQNIVYTTGDGLNWENFTFVGDILDAGYFEDRFAVVGNNGSIYTSTNGVTNWMEMGCVGFCFPFIGLFSSIFNGVPFSMFINAFSSEIWIKLSSFL